MKRYPKLIAEVLSPSTEKFDSLSETVRERGDKFEDYRQLESLSFEQILEELPDLELDDIKAALLYAVRKLDRPVLVA